MKVIKSILPFFIIFIVGCITFWKLPQTFFQQDEWAIFENLMYADKAKVSLFRFLFFNSSTHLVPFTSLLNLLQYRLFGLYFPLYAWSAIGFQLVNALLVFVLATVLINKRWVAVLAGVLFLVNSISHQAITWIATTNGTAGSTAFMLLALISFSLYLLRSEKNGRFLWSAYILFFISLGWKETTIFLFLFFPFFWLCMSQKKTLHNGLKVIIPLVAFGVVYVFLRIFVALFLTSGSPATPASAESYLFIYLFRIIAMPIRVLSQSFIPVQMTLRLAQSLLPFAYPHFVPAGEPNPYFMESVVSDIIFFLFFCMIVVARFLTVYYLRKAKQPRFVSFIDVSLIFIATSALPFIFVPGTAGYLSLLDGRHLYLTGIFTAIFTSIIFYALFLTFRRRKIVSIALVIFLTSLIVYHISRIHKDIDTQVALANERKFILNKIIASYPIVSNKVLFYIKSDKAYYGLPSKETIPPFQSGFGQTLIVWYEQQGANFPSCMFADKFLYELISEDYRECNDRGFGYFRKEESLIKAIKQHDLSSDNIIAFSYLSKDGALIDITDEIRKNMQ